VQNDVTEARPHWAEQVLNWLESAGISQARLAECSNTGKATWSRWLAGQPPADPKVLARGLRGLQRVGLPHHLLEQVKAAIYEAGGNTRQAMETLISDGSTAAPRGMKGRMTIEEAVMIHEVLHSEAMRLYGCPGQPFGELNGPEDVYIWPSLRSVATGLLGVVTGGQSMAVITGPTGSGKTTLKRMMSDQLDVDFGCRVLEPSLLDMSALSESAINRMILEAAGDDSGDFIDNHTRGSKARRALARMRKSGKVIIWIDQAEDLSDAGMVLLKRLHEERDGWTRLVTVVLSGQPQVRDHFRNARAAQFAIRSELMEMPGLTADDAWQLIQHRLRRAGMSAARIATVFPAETVESLALKVKALAVGGVVTPRQIENLVARAMNRSAQIGDATITPAMIDHVQDRD